MRAGANESFIRRCCLTSRDPADFLNDILISARLAREYVAGMSFDDFFADGKTRDSVVHRLEIVGEAARNLPVGITAAIPEIPWARVRGMRNLMAHHYWDINLKRVWGVVHEDLPPMISAIEAYLK